VKADLKYSKQIYRRGWGRDLPTPDRGDRRWWVGGQRHAPAALFQERNSVSILK